MPRKQNIRYKQLQRARDSGSPVNLLFFDTETVETRNQTKPNVKLHTLRLWCASACRLDNGRKTRYEWCNGKEFGSFWRFVRDRLHPTTPLWIFAHNLGYDLTQVHGWDAAISGLLSFVQYKDEPDTWDEAKDRVNWQGFAVLEDPPTILICRWKDTSKKLVLVDTLNYFQMPLAEIGQSIGIPKLPMPTDNADSGQWVAYCRRDVEIIESAVLSMLRMDRYHNLGGVKFTASGSAYQCYRYKFMPQEPGIHVHGHNGIRRLERQAYFGGLVEHLYSGRIVPGQEYLSMDTSIRNNMSVEPGPIYHLDKQSFYPSMMQFNDFPCRLLSTAVSPPLSWLMATLKTSGVIAQVQLDCSGLGFPTRTKEGTIRAIGRVYTTLCGPELARAVRENCIRGIGKVAVYQMADLFSGYVGFWDHLRKQYQREGNTCFEMMCKMYANSLYGRFGRWCNKWESKPDSIAPMPFGYWWEKGVKDTEAQCYRALAWLPQRMLLPPADDDTEKLPDEYGPMDRYKRKWEHPDAVPSIAAYVTSYGREEMLRVIGIAGRENVYYSDTDSVYCSQTGIDNLTLAGEVQPGAIGYLRLVGQHETAEFRSIKDYVIDGQETVLGVPKRCTPLPGRRYAYERFACITSTILSDNLSAVEVTDTTVDYSAACPRGQVGPDGIVRPLVVCQW